MNNEQNNANVGVNAIPPIQPQIIGDSGNSNIEKKDDTATNLTAVNVVTVSDNVGTKIDVVNPIPVSNSDGSSTVLMPNISIPEVKGGDSVTNVSSSNIISVKPISNDVVESNDNVNNSPQLNLESSSPFDIGVNAPLNTNVSNPSISQVEIKPIPVTGNSNNTSDININQNNTSDNNVVSFGTYLKTMILFIIPLIGFIVMIMKILDKDNKSISNFAKAYLVLYIIISIFIVAIFSLIGVLGTSMIGS